MEDELRKDGIEEYSARGSRASVGKGRAKNSKSMRVLVLQRMERLITVTYRSSVVLHFPENHSEAFESSSAKGRYYAIEVLKKIILSALQRKDGS